MAKKKEDEKILIGAIGARYRSGTWTRKCIYCVSFLGKNCEKLTELTGIAFKTTDNMMCDYYKKKGKQSDAK